MMEVTIRIVYLDDDDDDDDDNISAYDRYGLT
jgi:hypothetical protein